MSTKQNVKNTVQTRWAIFRFAVIGPLLSAPPKEGELQQKLEELADRTWQHPVTTQPVKFAKSTIERWFYNAVRDNNPVDALRTKIRSDANQSRQLSCKLKQEILMQYKAHPSWSYQLHTDNLAIIVQNSPELGPMVSYHTIRRYMQANNLCKQRRVKSKDTLGAFAAAERLAKLEVRSFEMDNVNALWHLDFHHGSCRILDSKGVWHKPLLLAIMDDRSRIICHAQWYLDETTETLVHGFCQALQKRGLPRALMCDNGPAMVAEEFTTGLSTLSILHQPTLPYSPYQNGKQETFWGQIEGRLLAMLEGKNELTLALLNEATCAWVELEYHHKLHSEINCTPMQRYLKGPNINRISPNSQALREAFCANSCRKQRKSDGSFRLLGKRFEVPAAFRHIEKLYIKYARWDLSKVYLIDPSTNSCISMLYPQDKSLNATAARRALPKTNQEVPQSPSEIAPLLKELMSKYTATGLPPAYIPKDEIL